MVYADAGQFVVGVIIEHTDNGKPLNTVTV
jgi:hypothetical protein